MSLLGPAERRQAGTQVRDITWHALKKPTREDRLRMCTGKRGYRTQGDALEAAAVIGLERWRKAYQCPICRKWHLTSR